MKPASSNKKKIIGILINSIDGFSHSPVIAGINKVAKEQNITILFFVGSSIKEQKDNIQKNIIYSLPNTEKLDGLILWSSSLVHYINVDDYEKFLQRYNGIPMISAGVPLKNIPSLVFDNKSSMILMVNHLIEFHKYSRIAFICGPLSNPDSISRFNGYEEALKSHNIPIDENLIVHGDFTEGSSFAAIDKLIKNNTLLPQVIVSSNDEMAIGACYRLKQLGIEAGKDIAITGFDNIEAAKYFSPSFTTISQPLFEIALKSMELLNDLIDGLEIPKHTYINGKLIIRESCGCSDIIKNNFFSKSIIPAKDNIDLEDDFDRFILKLKQNHDSIISSTIRVLGITKNQEVVGHTYINNLLNLFTNDIKEKNSNGQFLSFLTYILKDLIIANEHDCCYKEALCTFRNLILKLAESFKTLNLCNEIFYNACIVLSDILLKKETIDKYRIIRLYKSNRNILGRFRKTTNIEDLVDNVRSELSYYEVNQCFLCIYDKPLKNLDYDNFYIPDTVKLVLNYNNGKIGSTKYFDSADMLPPEYLYHINRDSLVFMPLCSDEYQFGYIVLSLHTIDEFFYETFREQISSSLTSQTLLAERKKAEEDLNFAIMALEKHNVELKNKYVIDELTGILNRRGFMIHGNSFYKSAMITGGKFILIFGDLDNFKTINDTYGHKEGDQAIVSAAKILKNSIENDDIVARLGGDEFIIIAANKATSEEVEKIIQTINYNFESYNLSSSKLYKLHISLGFSVYSSTSSLSFEELIEEADKKLYQEKKEKKLVH